jgi:hypothetical protein
MSSRKKLAKVLDIIRRGKKPTNESVFFPGIDDLYVFNGSTHSYDEMQKIVTEYENPDMPIIIWHEQRQY